MLTYDEALAKILTAAGKPLPAEEVVLEEARNRVLAAEILASENLPLFDNSAVDGYAVRLETVFPPQEALTLPLVETITAGSAPRGRLKAGEAARIFTGAPVPEGTTAVVMQEDASETEGLVTFSFDATSSGYIRRSGSDIAVGQRALPAGEILGAGGIGLLSALNFQAVNCHRKPRVGLLTTGNEVVAPGALPLLPGQIRDANGPALSAAIFEAGGVVLERRHAADEEEAVREALAGLADRCDLIVASGGVSVGDFDYVKNVALQLGELQFWRVAIKPGKPLAFGRIGSALFFGLPGNPVSSLVTFELFVRPVLRQWAGHRQLLRPQVTAVLATPLPHAPGRREFIRANVTWREDVYYATPLGAQGSHRLTSIAGANALLIAHEDQDDYASGDRLPAFLLR